MLTPQPKSLTFRSKKYLDFVRSHACCNCGWNPPQHLKHAHHTTTGGMGIKGSDYEAVPLCYACHSAMDNKRKDDIPDLAGIISRLQKEWEEKSS